MGRSRKRQRREQHRRDSGGHDAGSEPILTPTYVPVQADPVRPERIVEAPVLALDGLEPWAEIPGPALALEEAPETDDELGITFASPDQLELEPWRAEAPPVGVDVPKPHAPLAAPPSPTEPTGAAEQEADLPTLAAESVHVAPVFAAPAAPPPPDPSEVLYARARSAADEGRAAEAMGLYRELLGQNPRHVRARNNLALLLDAGGEHQAALAELDRALEMDPEHTTLLTNRGALLGALGRYAAAERDLRRVLRVEPSNVEALFNLGVVMTKKGLWSEAVAPLRRVTELDPERGPAFYYLGEALNHVDDLPGALAAYLRATELQPANARALYGLGIIYDRLARPDDAAVMYRKSREVARR